MLQLRHLLWATSKHDVYTTSEACIMHWSTVTQKATKVCVILNISQRPHTRSSAAHYRIDRTNGKAAYSQFYKSQQEDAYMGQALISGRPPCRELSTHSDNVRCLIATVSWGKSSLIGAVWRAQQEHACGEARRSPAGIKSCIDTKLQSRSGC